MQEEEQLGTIIQGKEPTYSVILAEVQEKNNTAVKNTQSCVTYDTAIQFYKLLKNNLRNTELLKKMHSHLLFLCGAVASYYFIQ